MKKLKYRLTNCNFPCRYFSYLQYLCLFVHTQYISLQTYFCTHIGLPQHNSRKLDTSIKLMMIVFARQSSTTAIQVNL